jgi:hypothetical protein
MDKKREDDSTNDFKKAGKAVRKALMRQTGNCCERRVSALYRYQVQNGGTNETD